MFAVTKRGATLSTRGVLFVVSLTALGCSNGWQSHKSMVDPTPRPACEMHDPPQEYTAPNVAEVDEDAAEEGWVFTEADLSSLVMEDDAEQSVGIEPDVPARDAVVVKEGGAPGCVNLNTATEVELVTLPGVGPGRAKKIIEARSKKRFEKRRQIKRVKGIGGKTYEKMKDQLCVL